MASGSTSSDAWAAPTQVPSSALPSSAKGLLHPVRTDFAGFSGPATGPLTLRTSTRNTAIKQTVDAFLHDAPERLWWTVKDVVVEGDGPWWRMMKAKRASASGNSLSSADPTRAEQEVRREDSRSSSTLKAHLGRYSLPARFPAFTTALRPSTPVIMLGGFRGSVLESVPRQSEEHVELGMGEKVWPNMARAMFNPGAPDLATLLAPFPPTPASSFVDPCPDSSPHPAEDDPANKIRATHMTNTIGGIVNMGWSLRRRLERLERAGSVSRVVRWGYDFRVPLRVSSAALIDECTRLRDEAAQRDRDGSGEGKGEGVTVFAHSMGGLVTLHALATCDDPTVFGQIIFFGTPWRGCAGIMGPFRTGDGFIRQRAICDAVTSSSWPASFHLLPTDPPFYTPEGDPVPLDLFKVENWDVYGLSPLAAGLASPFPDVPPGPRPDPSSTSPETARTSTPPAPSPGQSRTVREQAQLRHAERYALPARRPTRLSIRGAGTFPTAPEMGDPHPRPRPLARSRSRTSSSSQHEHRDRAQLLKHILRREREDRVDYHTGLAKDFEVDPHHYALNKKENEAALAYMHARSSLHPVNASSSTARAHFVRCLAEVASFRADILDGWDEGKRDRYPQIALIAGRSQQTIKGAVVSKAAPEAVATEGHERLVYDRGDGVVTWDSAVGIPGGWGKQVVKVVETKYGHLAAMSDTQAINDALLALERASAAHPTAPNA